MIFHVHFRAFTPFASFHNISCLYKINNFIYFFNITVSFRQLQILKFLLYNVKMPETLTGIDIIIRLCLAFAAGFIIGMERSSRRQAAGLRTHMLISLGASCMEN
jgi:hypothetical protein